MFYPSAIFRMKARAALKGHWQTALLVALIVNLPTLLMQGFSAYTGNDLITRLQAVMVAASRDGLMTQDLLLKEFDAILASTSFWTVRGLEVLAWLVTPCLTLGMYKWLMDRLRGQEDPVGTVLCRMKLFLKAIGLQLLIILKILLGNGPDDPGLSVRHSAGTPGSPAEQLQHDASRYAPDRRPRRNRRPALRHVGIHHGGRTRGENPLLHPPQQAADEG